MRFAKLSRKMSREGHEISTIRQHHSVETSQGKTDTQGRDSNEHRKIKPVEVTQGRESGSQGKLAR